MVTSEVRRRHIFLLAMHIHNMLLELSKPFANRDAHSSNNGMQFSSYVVSYRESVGIASLRFLFTVQ